MTSHSPIGASSMHRWSQCPGSIRLSKGIQPTTSKYAEEGTRAHEIAAFFLENGKYPEGPLTEEMADAVSVYTGLVSRDRSRVLKFKSSLVLVEHRFDLSSLYPGLFGTADAVVYDGNDKTLRVYDFKYGAGVAVEAEKNEQLLYYGLGALLSTGLPCETVELIIVQPRCSHPDGVVRSWALPAVELIDFSADLIDFAKRTEDPDAPLVSGEHCRFCPASGVCPEIHKKALLVAKEDFSPSLSYDPEKLRKTLEWLPVFEAWAKSVWEFAFGEAQHGRCPPGFKLVQKRGVRRWKSEDRTVEFLEEVAGLKAEDVFDRKLKSPAQIEKLLGKKDKNKIEELVTNESSGLTLVPDDDKRPAAKLDAKSEFNQIEENVFN